MPVPAQPTDARLTFNYSVEIDGLLVALVRGCQIPTVSVGVQEHGGAGTPHNVKTGGRLTFEPIVLEKVMPAQEGDRWAWDWLRTVRDPETGNTSGASTYKRNATILHYGNEQEVIDKWNVTGCFPSSIEYAQGQGGEDAEAMLETVTLTCDRYVRA